MNTRSLASIAVVLLAVSLAAAAPLQQVALAQQIDGQGMEMIATADEGSDTIMITGTIVKSLPTPVSIIVTSPSGANIVDIDQLTPVDNKFETMFMIGNLWKENGAYTITATSGIGESSLYKISLLVTVIEGMVAQDTMVMDGNIERLMVYDEESGAIPEPTGITIEATGEIGSNIIMVSGDTDRFGEDITLTVTAPNGNIVTVEQITPEIGGSYGAMITTGGDLWKEDGFYTVSVQQTDDPLYSASAEVDIADGLVVPEFGAIAAMILAVAIVAIIVVSAKSPRLNMITASSR